MSHRICFLVGFSFLSVLVESTFSIVASNAETKQIGGAGASCVRDFSIYDALYLPAPGYGLIHTQASALDHDSPIAQEAIKMIKEDEDLDKVLDYMVKAESFIIHVDSNTGKPVRQNGIRQHLLVSFDEHVGYTGSNITYLYEEAPFDPAIGGTPWFDTTQEDMGGHKPNSRYQFHAGGNVVTSKTVDLLKIGFEGRTYHGMSKTARCVEACDLAGRLMRALITVSSGRQGDERCLRTSGTSAAGAFIHIDNPDGSTYLHIDITGDASFEPVESLLDSFKQWRKKNPCPSMRGHHV